MRAVHIQVESEIVPTACNREAGCRFLEWKLRNGMVTRGHGKAASVVGNG